MGLICSGEVSGVTFYEQIEKYLMLYKNVQSLFEVRCYFRSKDKLFMALGGSRGSRVRCLHAFKGRSKSFEVFVENVSSAKAVFLDLELSKGDTWRRSGFLDVDIYI